MFNTLNVSEMMKVDGGFYYVPRYVGTTFYDLVQVENTWGNGGYKCYIRKGGSWVKSKKYPWE